MKFGVTLPYGRPDHPGAIDAKFAAPVIQRAEELGFESVWAGEHVAMVEDYQTSSSAGWRAPPRC